MAITQTISPIPEFLHRDEVVTPEQQNQFVREFENTIDSLRQKTVLELNTFATQVNEAGEQINTDSKEVTDTIEETRLIKSQVEQIQNQTSQIKDDTNQIKTETSQIKDETTEIKTEVENYVATMPEGAVNDEIVSPVTTWSSQKIANSSIVEAAFITHSFSANEELEIPLNKDIDGAIIGVQKEVPQTELVNEDWLVSADEFEGESGIIITNTISTTVTNQYKTATSKTPINTSLWAEINSFIPTQTLNNGEINYSFSKDNKESFIVSNGTSERTVVKNDGGVWKYNSNVVFEAETFENASVNDMNVALDEAMGSAVVEKSEAWDLKGVIYSNKSFSVTSQDTTPIGLTFSPDGLKMFVLGNATDTVYQYSLTTAYDISTASYSNKSFSVTSQEGNPYGLAFSPDGLKMFILGSINKTVYEYNLLTSFDVSTATYSNKSFSVGSQDSSPLGVTFSPDGLKMFVMGNATDKIYQYTLTTSFDVSTAIYSNKSFSIATQSGNNYQIVFSTDGFKMFVVGASLNSILEYSLSSSFDISTASYKKGFNASSQDTAPRGLAFSNDGLKMFILGLTNKTVYEYNLFIIQSQNIQPPTSFELSDNLNLAITMKSTGTSPAFTNMDINYDGFSKWQKATPNTDYQTWQQGDNNKVTIKALSANNLKIRVI